MTDDNEALAYWVDLAQTRSKLLDEQYAEVEELRGLLRAIEWQPKRTGHLGDCPACGQYCMDGHHPDCRLAAALEGTK